MSHRGSMPGQRLCSDLGLEVWGGINNKDQCHLLWAQNCPGHLGIHYLINRQEHLSQESLASRKSIINVICDYIGF